MSKNYRNYKINFTFNSKYEIAYIPGEYYHLHLEQSKAAIHIYHYLCLHANKSVDLGFVRNITTQKIANDLGMPLRTVQDGVSRLIQSELIEKWFVNNDRSLDLYINGYTEMFGKKMNYIKLPGFVFTDEFLCYDKAEINCSLNSYYSVYKNTMASLQQIKATDHKNKENWELIDYAKTNREFTEETLLKIIKRASVKDLDKTIAKINETGFLEIIDVTEGNFRSSVRKFVIRATQAIKSVFNPIPGPEKQSYIETYKLAFKQVYFYLKDYTMESYFSAKEDLESLTKTFVTYGEALFVRGILSFVDRINLYGDPVDKNGDIILNPCGYIVSSITNFIEAKKQNTSYLTI